MNVTDLYLLGCGIRGALHLSAETIQALRICHTVFLLHDDLSVHEALRKYCTNVFDLAEVYKGGGRRQEVYQRIAALVIESAVKRPGVAFASHGHPLFLVSAAEYMLSLAREKMLRVEILPAISSFDTILCDLRIDYGYNVQLFDASTLVQQNLSPNVQIPLVLFNLASFLDEEIVFRSPPSEVLTPLWRHLSRFYSQSHQCAVVHSASHLLEKSTTCTIQLRELVSGFPIELWKRPSLFVPSARE